MNGFRSSSKRKLRTDPAALLPKLPARIQIIGRRLQTWFLASAIIGVTTGVAVSGFDYAITELLKFNLEKLSSSTLVLVILMPTIGLGIAGVLLAYFTKNDGFGTEEVISAYHNPQGKLEMKYAPVKLLASIFSIGFGGSAGLEGPSIYIGAAFGSLVNRFLKFFHLEAESIKAVMIAGSAAGIAAIFKAPLTGIVFALEVPYKDDLAKESLIPSLVAAVTSYFTLVSIMGIEPLFKTTQIFSLDYMDLVFAGILGFFIGLAGRLFVIIFRRTEHFFIHLKWPLPAKMAFGGALTGLTGVIAILWFGSPLSLGVGYNSIGNIINETLATKALIGLLALKAFATIATLAPGGAGGIFIPMIMMGGILGAILSKFVPYERGHLYPIIGMPSFLAAGYKTPLAAVCFVAETTGSPYYIIPGLIAAAVGYAVSGRISVSQNQRWSRITKLELLLSTRVSQVMTPEAQTIPADIPANEFFDKYLMQYRHKSMPVVEENGDLAGMIAVSDFRKIPKEEWSEVKIRDLAVEDVFLAYADQPLADLLDVMQTRKIDRMPVVDRSEPKKIIGVISSADIVSVEELAKLQMNRRRGPYVTNR